MYSEENIKFSKWKRSLLGKGMDCPRRGNVSWISIIETVEEDSYYQIAKYASKIDRLVSRNEDKLYLEYSSFDAPAKTMFIRISSTILKTEVHVEDQQRSILILIAGYVVCLDATGILSRSRLFISVICFTIDVDGFWYRRIRKLADRFGTVRLDVQSNLAVL